MSVNKYLVQSFVNKLLEGSPEDKLFYQNKIIDLLGGDSTPNVNNLPPRRGRADGGLDGRVPVIAPLIIKQTLPNTLLPNTRGVLFEIGNNVLQEAGINIKIQKQKFSIEQFGGFKDALEREKLYVGIIITALDLSPDVKQRIYDIQQDKIYIFAHILLQDLLMGEIKVKGFDFACGDISLQIFRELSKSIE